MTKPPFTVSAKAVNLVAEIVEVLGAIRNIESSFRRVELRKENRIKTIQGSLAIENNSLSFDQITAILDGKRVLGAPHEILEVKNAIQAYELLLELNPYEEKDLLRAHSLMMNDLVSRSGKYRDSSVGVIAGKEVVHLAPPADRVSYLMSDLFEWLKSSEEHPLIKSCVFHYEFEFIHPFSDGNGRMGRFWQTVILKEWKSIFAWIPVEVLVKENQIAYYEALGSSDSDGSSTAFIEFMLELILRSIREIVASEKMAPKVNKKVSLKVSENQREILKAIKKNPFVSLEDLSEIVGIARKNVSANITKMKIAGLIRRVGARKSGYWEIVKRP
ncbi:MAG: Fic family protein [Opitutales bacterium]|nr:Fic family protein [Opitutales bacterium]